MDLLMSDNGKKPPCRVNAQPRLCHFTAKGGNRNQLFAYAGGREDAEAPVQREHRPDN